MKVHQYTFKVAFDVASAEVQNDLATAFVEKLQPEFERWARHYGLISGQMAVSILDHDTLPNAHDANDSFEREAAAQARVREFMRSH